MILKPQDILVLLKLVAIGPVEWAYNKLAVELEMSPAEVHAAIKRALDARLAVQLENHIQPHMNNLEEFLIHGLKYVFVPVPGELTRGIPTRFAANPLKRAFGPTNEAPPVWPDPEGPIRGFNFSPLYSAAPKAAQKDAMLYELLVLVDALRGGSARERKIATTELKKRFRNYGKATKSKS